MRTYEIPVLIKVTVEVNDDGSARVERAEPDNECAPWAGSADPAGWEPSTQQWHTDHDSPCEGAWQFAYQWLEHHDLVTVLRVARMQTLLVTALKRFDQWPAHARQDGLCEAYRAAHVALGFVEGVERRDPFKFYLRRLGKRKGVA